MVSLLPFPHAFFCLQTQFFANIERNMHFGEKIIRTKVVLRKICHEITYSMLGLRFLVRLQKSSEVGLRTTKNRFSLDFSRKPYFGEESFEEKLFYIKFPIQLCITCLAYDLWFANITRSLFHNQKIGFLEISRKTHVSGKTVSNKCYSA